LPRLWLWPHACAFPFLSASASESSPEEDDEDDDDSSLDSSTAFGLWYMQHTECGLSAGDRGLQRRLVEWHRTFGAFAAETFVVDDVLSPLDGSPVCIPHAAQAQDPAWCFFLALLRGLLLYGGRL
jgi:hypothetical protein